MLVFLAALVPLPPASTAPPEKGETLSQQQQTELATLLAQFRRNAADADARKKAADRIFEIGGPAPARLLAVVNVEMRPLYAAYQQAFAKQAVQALREKLKDAKQQDVESLRGTILDTVAADNLTKEMVVARADPALKKLEEMLLVSADAVVAGAPALQQQRVRLTALGELWQRCMDHAAKRSPAPAAGAGDAADFKRVLQTEEETGTLLALAPDDSLRKALVENVALEAKIRPDEAAGIRLLNRIRLVTGLAPLRIDPALCDAARDHSKDMATMNFFGHDSPVPGKRTPWDRASRFGTSASAENIYVGNTNPANAIMGWWHSPGHLKNMMGKRPRVGLGRHEKHWTQMFG